MPKVVIIGYGWVGKAMQKLFPDALIYDPLLDFKTTKEEVNECDVAFICVPTPNTWITTKQTPELEIQVCEGKLDTSIVEEVISWCKCSLLVIRSTVNPGTSQRLEIKYNKRIVMQPEYLGETVNHPMTDQKSRPFMVIGGEPLNRRELINLYQTVYNASITIRQVTLREAEVIKLSENRAIAFKVAECQELYDACESNGIDYYTIREAVYGDDPRFNLWWSFVFPDKRGFNSKCIPKDVYAWCAWAESMGYKPVITKALLEKNKEWIGWPLDNKKKTK
jgi:UDPglucose 6-dehydrogenase